MSYAGMGLVFAAIAFVVANLALTVVSVAVWPLVRSRMHRPGGLLLLRLLPSAGAMMAAAGLALPAYLSFEPRQTGERASAALLVFVAVAASLLAAGILRWVVSWLTTRRLETAWRTVSEPSMVRGVRVERVPTALPFAAIVGILRPRLYVSATLMDVLTEEQCAAVVAHEAGHGRALDNLKRGLLRLAPDVLALTRTGRAIEAAWSAAAEEAADDHAAGGSAAGRLAVAEALVTASRLAPFRLATVSSFCDSGTVGRRVARLIDEPPPSRGERVLRIVSFSALTLAAATAVLSLPLVYAATETIVRRLQ